MGGQLLDFVQVGLICKNGSSICLVSGKDDFWGRESTQIREQTRGTPQMPATWFSSELSTPRWFWWNTHLPRQIELQEQYPYWYSLSKLWFANWRRWGRKLRMIRGSVINPTTMSFGGVGNDCYKSRARSLLCTLQTSVNGHMKIINIQYSVPAIDAIKNNTAKKVKECLRKSANIFYNIKNTLFSSNL
jgi:hypothetical protein